METLGRAALNGRTNSDRTDRSDVHRDTISLLCFLAFRFYLMETLFRIAEPSDAETLVQFMQEYCAFDHLPFEEENRRRTVAQFIQNSQLGRLWVICAGEEPLGYLALTLGYSFE